MNEKSLVSEIVEQLSNDFLFEKQVSGKHFSGQQFKIDYIIKPLITNGWKNPQVCFGLEFKDLPNLDQKGDTKDFSKWLAQCVDYSNTYWNNYGYIYILTCPGITTSRFLQQVDASWMLTRIMAHLGIGELKFSNPYGWTITLSGQHRLWSQKNGVEMAGKSWNLQRCFGSR